MKSGEKQIKEQREEQILKAALEVFTLQGYAAATVQKIARVAGVAVGTIYKYFTSKDELFIAVMNKVLVTVPVLDNIDNISDDDLTITFKKLIKNWFKVTETEPGSRIHYLLSEIVRNPELRYLWVEQCIQPFLIQIETIYSSMIASGRLRNINVVIAVRAVVSLVIGFNTLSYLEDDKSPVIKLPKEELSNALADFIMNGLAPTTETNSY